MRAAPLARSWSLLAGLALGGVLGFAGLALSANVLLREVPGNQEYPWIAFALRSAFPAAGTAGRLAYATDEGTLYRDTGAAWDQTLPISTTAQVWDDLRIEPTLRATGPNIATFSQWLTDGAGSRGVYLYSFDDSATEKEVHFTMQLPHDWNQDDITIHVHWIGDATEAAMLPCWGLEYNWKEPEAVFGNTTIVTATALFCGELGTTQYEHELTPFAVASPDATQDGISSVLIGRLFRNSSAASDTYVGHTCGLLYIDAHYRRIRVGSKGEYQ